MFPIISKRRLAQDISKVIVRAPHIARQAKPGQFVVAVIDEKAERIPLTLADWDRENETICLIFQEVGFTTRRLGLLNAGESIPHLLGPLGHPADIQKIGTLVCIGGGVGIAEVYPLSRAFKQAGNRVIGIIGSRSKDLLILEDEMQQVCDELFVTTDDGSYRRKGLVSDVLKELLVAVEKSTNTTYPQLVYCIGPVLMMKAVSQLTLEYKIKTLISANPIMVDATGMCGSCRCTVGGRTVFGCVDGPEFDGHQIDFDELAKRQNLFKQQEDRVK